MDLKEKQQKIFIQLISELVLQVPLILGIWGGKGQGKSFQCELVMSKLGIK
jgi:pantothenate kinase-related protein Tda10